MQKIINSNTAKYQPMLTDNLVLDAVPTVNSFNGVTSDAVARAIAGASGEVPQVTEADNGKVLTAVYDEGGAAVEWGTVQSGAEYSAGTGISISEQNEISVSSDIRNGAAAGATALQPSALEAYTPTASLATVATSGNYSDLNGKPTIPAAQVNSDWNASSGVAQILNKPSLATVATSGSYADLSNKPTIPTVDQSYSFSSTNAQSGTAVASAISMVNQVPFSTSADEDKVLTVNSSGNAVWAAAQGGGSSYTAGDGIDISAQDEISVKAGNGLTIADYSYEHTGTRNLTATPFLLDGSYKTPCIAQLTQEMLAQMNSTEGLQVTLTGSYAQSEKDLYLGLANVGDAFSFDFAHYVVFGPTLGQSIASGTTVTFNFANYTEGDSYATVAADVSNYYLVILYKVYGNVWGNTGTDAPSADPIVTGTYTSTETVTVQNAVNLATPIEVVASMPASPTSGTLYIVTGA